MGRSRKKSEENGDPNGTAVLDPPSGETSGGTQTEETAGQPAAPKTRPAASFAASSDRTTRIEVAVWARQVKVSESEEYTQYSLTLTRSWRNMDGQWTENDFYRVHDVPVLLFLVQQAYHWCVAQRMQVHVRTDESLPF